MSSKINSLEKLVENSDEMQSSDSEEHHQPLGWIAKAIKCFKIGVKLYFYT